MRFRGNLGMRLFDVPSRMPRSRRSLSPCHAIPAIWCARAHALSQPRWVDAHVHTAATRRMCWTGQPRGTLPNMSVAHAIIRKWDAYVLLDAEEILHKYLRSATSSAILPMSAPLSLAAAKARRTMDGGAPSLDLCVDPRGRPSAPMTSAGPDACALSNADTICQNRLHMRSASSGEDFDVSSLCSLLNPASLARFDPVSDWSCIEEHAVHWSPSGAAGAPPTGEERKNGDPEREPKLAHRRVDNLLPRRGQGNGRAAKPAGA